MRRYRFFVSPIDLDDLESIDKAIRQMRIHVAQLDVERGKLLEVLVNDKQLDLFNYGKEKDIA